jgi:hypothetical protein
VGLNAWLTFDAAPAKSRQLAGTLDAPSVVVAGAVVVPELVVVGAGAVVVAAVVTVTDGTVGGVLDLLLPPHPATNTATSARPARVIDTVFWNVTQAGPVYTETWDSAGPHAKAGGPKVGPRAPG